MTFKTFCAFFILYLFHLNLYADEIKLLDGSKLKCVIKSASDKYITYMTEDSSLTEILKDSVFSILFSASDEVTLNTFQVITCKILEDDSSHTRVVNDKGLFYLLPKDILFKKYNSSGKLQLRMLPATGLAFKSSSIKLRRLLRRNVFVGLSLISQRTDVDAWRNEIFYNKSEFMPSIGAVLGYHFRNRINPIIGYEMWLQTKDESAEFQSRLNIKYLFLGIEYGIPLQAISNLQLHTSIYTGIADIRGDIFVYSYRKYEVKEQQFAFRPQIGILYVVTDYISLNLALSYMIIPSLKLECPVACKNDISLQMDGLLFYSRVCFYLPYQKKR